MFLPGLRRCKIVIENNIYLRYKSHFTDDLGSYYAVFYVVAVMFEAEFSYVGYVMRELIELFCSDCAV